MDVGQLRCMGFNETKVKVYKVFLTLAANTTHASLFRFLSDSELVFPMSDCHQQVVVVGERRRKEMGGG